MSTTLRTAANDSAPDAAIENTPLTVSATEGVLANDIDVDTPHGSLFVTTTMVATAHGGSITFTPDGGYTYTPAANYQRHGQRAIHRERRRRDQRNADNRGH